jgi:hypothetical protein
MLRWLKKFVLCWLRMCFAGCLIFRFCFCCFVVVVVVVVVVVDFALLLLLFLKYFANSHSWDHVEKNWDPLPYKGLNLCYMSKILSIFVDSLILFCFIFCNFCYLSQIFKYFANFGCWDQPFSLDIARVECIF